MRKYWLCLVYCCLLLCLVFSFYCISLHVLKIFCTALYILLTSRDAFWLFSPLREAPLLVICTSTVRANAFTCHISEGSCLLFCFLTYNYNSLTLSRWAWLSLFIKKTGIIIEIICWSQVCIWQCLQLNLEHLYALDCVWVSDRWRETFDWWYVGVSEESEREMDRKGYKIVHTYISEVMKQRLQTTVSCYPVSF